MKIGKFEIIKYKDGSYRTYGKEQSIYLDISCSLLATISDISIILDQFKDKGWEDAEVYSEAGYYGAINYKALPFRASTQEEIDAYGNNIKAEKIKQREQNKKNKTLKEREEIALYEKLKKKYGDIPWEAEE